MKRRITFYGFALCLLLLGRPFWGKCQTTEEWKEYATKLESGWAMLANDQNEEALSLGEELQQSMDKADNIPDSLYAQALHLEGRAWLQALRWEEAELYLKSTLGSFSANPAAWRDWSWLAFRKGAYEEAFRRLDQALLHAAQNKEERNKVRLQEADYCIRIGLQERAKKALELIEGTPKDGLDQLYYEFLQSERDRIYGVQRILKEKLAFMESFEAAHPTLTPATQVYKVLLEAIWHTGKESPQKQRERLENIRELVGSPSFPALLASRYWENMAIYADGERPDLEVLGYFQKSEEAYDKFFEKGHLAKVDFALKKANYLFEGGDYTQMLKLMNSCEQQIQQAGIEDHNALPYIWRNQSMAYRKIGDMERALELIKRAVFMMEELFVETHWELGGFYNTLANSYSNMDLESEEYQQMALETHFKALEIDEEKFGSESYEIAMLYHNIGMTYLYLNEMDKALEYYQKGLRISIQNLGPDHLNVANSHFGLGELYLSMGDLDKSIEEIRRAVEIYTQKVPPTHDGRISAYMFMGYVYLFLPNEDSALHYLEQAFDGYFPHIPFDSLELLERPENFHMYGMQNISNLLGIIGDFFIETEQLYKARKAYKALISWIDQYELNSSFGEAGWTRNMTYSNDYASMLSINYHLFQKTGNPIFKEEAFALADKSKTNTLRYQLQGNKALDFSDISQTEIEQGKELYEAYTQVEKRFIRDRQLSLNPTVMSKQELELSQKKRAYLDWQNYVERQYPNYFQLKYDQHLIFPDEVRDKINSEKTLVIEYFWLENQFLYKFAFDKEKIVFLVDTLQGDFGLEVDSFIQKLTQPDFAENHSFDKESFDRFVSQSHSLYQQLLGSLLDSFEHPTFDQLLIIPHGKLNKFPFEVLLTEEKEYDHVAYHDLPYLLRKYKVRHEFAASLVQDPSDDPRPASYPYLGLAPNFSSAYRRQAPSDSNPEAFVPGLQYNDQEIDQAYDLLGGMRLKGNEVQESMVKQYLEEASILHFATHTLLNDTFPMYTSLMLGEENDADGEDGFLHAYEIYPKSLKAQLAVLSACETGLGKWRKGEGMMSLGRAFKYAGCPNIVMSLWQADDEASSEIMAQFFTYLKQGLNKDEALRKAKLAYLESTNGKQFPHYWAPFVLVGDDKQVQVSSSSFGQREWVMLFSLLGVLALGIILMRRQREGK